jgi:enamine deaminase RidA (YjgF/YER057c/UK114 family)
MPGANEGEAVPTRETHTFGNFMEEAWGFAEGVKVGDTIYVSGQTGYDQSFQIAIGDMEAQMRQAYATIATVLAGLGASIADVVDETLFVTDVMAAATHGLAVRTDVYGGTPRVASTLVEVSRLAIPGMRVEIEVVVGLPRRRATRAASRAGTPPPAR